MWKENFTTEQKERVVTHVNAIGVEKVRQIEKGWTSNLAALRTAMAKGIEPSSPEVRAIVVRLRELTCAFSGGDVAIEQVLTDAYRSGAGAPYGVDTALTDYIAQAARRDERGNGA